VIRNHEDHAARPALPHVPVTSGYGRYIRKIVRRADRPPAGRINGQDPGKINGKAGEDQEAAVRRRCQRASRPPSVATSSLVNAYPMWSRQAPSMCMYRG